MKPTTDIYTISFHDAITLLESGERVTIKVWKLSTGEELTYTDCICVGCHRRGGTHRVQLAYSGLMREFRDITLHEINGLKIYR